jgi:hypothetical protein
MHPEAATTSVEWLVAEHLSWLFIAMHCFKNGRGLSTLTKLIRQFNMQADLKHFETNSNCSTQSHMKHLKYRNQ